MLLNLFLRLGASSDARPRARGGRARALRPHGPLAGRGVVPGFPPRSGAGTMASTRRRHDASPARASAGRRADGSSPRRYRRLRRPARLSSSPAPGPPMAGGMSTTVEAPQAETLAAAAPPREDLSKYDSRRAIARAVDGVFVGAPFLIPVLGLPFGLSVAIVAVSLLVLLPLRGAVGPDARQAPARSARADARRRPPRPRRPSACARRRGSSRTARSASPSSSPPASAAGGSATCSATRSSRAPRPACRAPASPPS